MDLGIHCQSHAQIVCVAQSSVPSQHFVALPGAREEQNMYWDL
jgi:hypothetical protein